MTDILPTIISIINSNWNEINCVKPNTVDEMFDKKFTNLSTQETILVFETGQNREPFGLGAGVFQVKYNVSCDIMTTTSRARAVAIRDELIRCFRQELKVNKEFIIVNRVLDKSNELRKIWRYIVDIEYTQWENYTS